MPRDGAVVLSDLRNPTLSIVCGGVTSRNHTVPRFTA